MTRGAEVFSNFLRVQLLRVPRFLMQPAEVRAPGFSSGFDASLRPDEGAPVSHPGLMRASGLHPPGLTPADAASAGVIQPRDV